MQRNKTEMITVLLQNLASQKQAIHFIKEIKKIYIRN